LIGESVPTALATHWRSRLLTATVLVAGGVCFNVARLVVHLDQASVASSLVAFLALLGFAAVCGRATGLSWRDLGFVRVRTGRVWFGTALCSALFAGVAFVTAPALRIPNLEQVGLGLLLFAVGVAPAEELFYRGVLFATAEKSFGPSGAVVLTSLAFAVAHAPVYGIGSLGVTACAGLLLGWLRLWSGSLAPSTAAHVVADLTLLWL
jgi:membrane protease YdiL (CAAX protease family)